MNSIFDTVTEKIGGGYGSAIEPLPSTLEAVGPCWLLYMGGCELENAI